MGGIGSGGKRVGSGRKAKLERERQLAGSRVRTRARDAGATTAKPRTAKNRPEPSAPAVIKPTDLTPIAADVWDLLAPGALASGTLTPTTAYAFRRLCELETDRRAMRALIEADGFTITNAEGEPKAHPLLARENALQVRVEQGMVRFMVTALGKSMAPDEPDEVDPFAEFDGPASLQVIRGGKA
jgi:phage terminase small subunit